MSLRALAALLVSGLLSGCVQQAVLENDIRTAQWKSRTLATATDLDLAYAALSAQLVELEALYQRDRSDERVRELLARGYALMARGFVELRRLEALARGESARATREQQLRADAAARARYYAVSAPRLAVDEMPFESALAGAAAACARHDRARYEHELNALLGAAEATGEGRLQQALARRQASAWLSVGVAERCRFRD